MPTCACYCPPCVHEIHCGSPHCEITHDLPSPETPEEDIDALRVIESLPDDAPFYEVRQKVIWNLVKKRSKKRQRTVMPSGCTCPPWGNPSWPHRHNCPFAQDERPDSGVFSVTTVPTEENRRRRHMKVSFEEQHPRPRVITLKAEGGAPLVQAQWYSNGMDTGWLIELQDGTGLMFKASALDNTADPADREVREPIHRLMALLAVGSQLEHSELDYGEVDYR